MDADSEERGVPRGAPPDREAKRRTDQPPSRAAREEGRSRAAPDEAPAAPGTPRRLRGTSARLRRWADAIPEHRAGHRMLLVAADRMDVLEDRLGQALGGVFGALGLKGVERRLRTDPLPPLMGAAAGALLARRILKDD